MSGQVKWFSSENKNAPSLDNTWGSLLNVIKFCLLSGYGDQPVSSITISDGVGVAHFPSDHDLEMFQVVRFSGSSNTALNQEFKILGLTTNTIEFLIDLSDQMISEPMVCSLASLGWSMPFGDEGRAVFQAKNTEKNPYYLRIDDTCDPLHTTTAGKFAKVGIMETCAGIDDISGNQAPFDPELPTKNWIGSTVGSTKYIGWTRWTYATAATRVDASTALTATALNGIRDWVLVGEDENFYILPTVMLNNQTNTAKQDAIGCGFGIIDGIDCPFLCARYYYGNIANSYWPGDESTFTNLANGYLILLKNRDGSYITGSDIASKNTRLIYGFGATNSTGNSNIFLNNADDGVYHSDYHVRDAIGAYVGVLPLARYVLNSPPAGLERLATLSDQGRVYVRARHVGQSGQRGSIMFDLGDI